MSSSERAGNGLLQLVGMLDGVPDSDDGDGDEEEEGEEDDFVDMMLGSSS